MNHFKKENIDLPPDSFHANNLDKAKLIEVMNDIQMKEEARQRIIAACTAKTDAAGGRRKSALRMFGTRISARQAALPALAAVLALSIVGYNLFAGLWTGPELTSSETSSASQKPSENSSSASQTVNSQDLTPIVVSVPKWFSPGELVANQFYQNFLPGTTLQQTLSSQYIYVNAQKDAIFKTEEHKNCRNFGFNVKTGAMECFDHPIRKILIPAGIMQETDRIWFKDCAPSDEFALIDIRTAKDAFKSTYRYNLLTGEFLKIKEDLNHIEEWTVFKDYSTLITVPEYSSGWKIYLVDIVSGTKKNIVSEANATSMFALSPSNQYVWYSIFKNGNKNLRCIYSIATGAKTFITTERYPFFTPDDRYVLYFAGGKIRRLNLASKEDVVIVEKAVWTTQGGIDIAAYDEAAGRLILSAFDTYNHFDLYSLDVRTNKMVHIVDPDNGVQLAAPDGGVKAQYTQVLGSKTAMAKGGFSRIAAGFLNFSTPSKVALSSTGSYAISYDSNSIYSNYISYNKSSNYGSNDNSYNNASGSYESYAPSSYQEDSKDISKQPQSIPEDLQEPEPAVARGASAYLFDKTGKYIFYYTDLHDKGGNIYCYDIASGDQFAVALPEEFVKKLMVERQNLLHPDKPFIVSYRLYLSDDATHIYLTYEISRSIYIDPIPLSRLVEFAKKNNTIIHFGKYFDQRYYDSDLPGRSYSTYTDDGKIAVLNENYSTHKFALILFDKPFDTSKPYGGGKVLTEKELPADADWSLADWWDHCYEAGTVVYNLDDVIEFVKTHDSLNGFTKIFDRYSMGWNDDSGTETEFNYQVCVGPNQYVNVNEHYTDRKLQVIGAISGTILYERALNPAIKNSDRLR
ncbi:MAG: TolB family protein [Saccharofermentanales bacterium]